MELSAEERERVLQNALAKLEAAREPETVREQTAREPAVPALEPAPEAGRRAGRRRGKRRFARALGLLAAALTAGMLTAGATGLFDVGGALYQIFGTSAEPELIEALGVAGYPIRLSQTQGGYTVALQGVVGDRNSCYLVFDVTAPEGETLDGAYGFQRREVGPESPLSAGSCGYYIEQLPDEDPTDNVVSFLAAYDGERTIPGKTFRLGLETLVEYVDDRSGDGEWDNEKIVADESWEFTFRMEYEDVSLRVPVDGAEGFRGTDARLCGIYVSPLSVRLEYRKSLLERLFEGKGSLDAEAQSELVERVMQPRPAVVLHFRDGSEFAVGVDADGQLYGGMSGSTNSSGVTSLNASYSFDRPVNTAELVSVEVDGVEYPVR